GDRRHLPLVPPSPPAASRSRRCSHRLRLIMTSRNLSILGLVAVLAVVAGVWLASRQASTPATESAELYPDLEEQLDAVTAVRIVKAGGTPAVELKRGDD